jgi:hypothetical protein
MCGNPNGRPRRAPTTGQAILKAASAKVTVTEGGRRRKVSKLEAAATQIVNRGVSGDLRAGKMALEFAQRAEEKAAALPAAEQLTDSDAAIVQGLFERWQIINRGEGREPSDTG